MALLKQLKDSMPQTYIFLLKMIPRLRLSVVFWFSENMLFKEAKEEGTTTKRHLNHVSGSENETVCTAGVFQDCLLSSS